MEPGRLRHVVDLQYPVETQGPSGEIEATYQTWAANVRASIEDLSSREQEFVRQVAGEASTRIRIRYRPGVNEKMRVLHIREASGSPNLVDVYDVIGVTRDLATSRLELQLLCVLRVSEGFRRGD